MSTKLANRLTVAEVVRVYDAATEKIRGGFALINQAEAELNETFTLDGLGQISVRGYGHRISYDERTCEDVLLSMRHEVWSYVIERLEVRRAMSVRRWDELQQQLRDKQLPEITEENVEQLVAGFRSNLQVMLGEAVEEVFDWLRPRGSKYKTNTELEIRHKVILRHVVEARDKRWSHFTWRVDHRYQQNLSALENVFTALAGRGQITKSHFSEITNVVHAPGYSGVGETPYFRFKTFENGNMHLEFLKLDLLARFNAIAGGRRLRPAAAAE